MITPTNLNDLAQQIHANAKAKGFWDEPRNTGEVFMLIVSELGEALEAHRIGKRVGESIDFGVWGIMVDGHFKQSFEREVKDTFEDEISDVVIRILDWCAYKNIGVSVSDRLSDFQVSEYDRVGDVLMDVNQCLCMACTNQRSVDFVDSERNREAVEECVNDALIICFKLADAQGFDLMRHIELKMKYNATRERLHGKKY